MAKSYVANRQSKAILRALMDTSGLEEERWPSADLRAILDHQLDTSLVVEIDRFAEVTGYSPKKVKSIIKDSGCTSFRQLLTHAAPSREGLRLIKDFAKSALANAGELPKDVARFIYVLSILRARCAGLADLTSLKTSSIEREARRCLTFRWLSDGSRHLLRESISCKQAAS